jgi:methyl-accepting chemotaxis protein
MSGNRNTWTLKTIITLLVSGIIVSSFAVTTLVVRNKIKESILQGVIDRARTVGLQADATREYAADLYNKKLYDDAKLAKDVRNLVATVPIVAAFKTAGAKAKEAGFEFRVPKEFPRNPANNPDPEELAVLKGLQARQGEPGTPDHSHIDEKMNAVRYFRAIRLTEECMACHGNPSDSLKYWGRKDGTDPTGAKMEGWSVGQIHGAYEVIAPLEGADKAVANVTMWTVLAGLAGCIVSVLIINGFMKRYIFARLEVATQQMEAVASGDLTVNISDPREDELGTGFSAFNRMVEAIRSLTVDTIAASNSVAQSAAGLTTSSSQMASNSELMTQQANIASTGSDDISANVKSMAAGIEQISANSNTVASASEEVSTNLRTVGAAVEQMSSNMKTISSTTEQVTNSVNTVAAAIEEMSASLNEVSKNSGQAASVANKAAKSANSTAETVDKLGKSAQEIGKVVDMIKGIAAQTNLLALNATIEAASAGEAGRGFAVVANEVKELAKQTAGATEEIRAQVEGMQANTQQAVKAIDEIVQVINEINTISSSIAASVEEQTATTNEIAKNVGFAARGAGDVSKNVQQAAMGANEVSRNVQEAVKGVTDISKNINQLASGATELARNAGAAARGMNEVAQNVAKVSDAARETTRGAGDTNTAARELARLAEKLQSAVSRFKL